MASSLASLKTYQEEHDRLYHKDIYLLSHPDKLKHFALHFAKYAGRLSKTARKQGTNIRQTLCDILIIALSASNILNLDIDSQRLKLKLNGPDADENLEDWLHDKISYYNGKIAKVCEAYDHMETHEYKKALKSGTKSIIVTVLYYADTIEYDVKTEVVNRWKIIEKNQIL